MNVQIENLEPIRVVMMSHVGPYDGLSNVFDELWGWVEKNNVPVQRTIGVYWDNPDYVSSSQLRSAACVEVPPTFIITDAGGLPIKLASITGGPYATTRFVGPYENLAPVWSDMTRYVENDLRRTISQNPAFEVYVNDASETPAQQLITDLYLPVL